MKSKQVELPSLIGDVALKDGKPVVHAHAVIGKKAAIYSRHISASNFL